MYGVCTEYVVEDLLAGSETRRGSRVGLTGRAAGCCVQDTASPVGRRGEKDRVPTLDVVVSPRSAGERWAATVRRNGARGGDGGCGWLLFLLGRMINLGAG